MSWPFRKKGPMSVDALPLEAPSWSVDWSEASLDLAYSAAETVRDAQSAWADALDGKIVGVFGIASVLLAVVPTLKTPDTALGKALWIVATLMWLGACWACYSAYKPAPFRVGPNPQTLLGKEWLGRSPRDFRLWRLASMGRSYQYNSSVISSKGRSLAIALALTAAEILCLTASLFASAPC